MVHLGRVIAGAALRSAPAWRDVNIAPYPRARLAVVNRSGARYLELYRNVVKCHFKIDVVDTVRQYPADGIGFADGVAFYSEAADNHFYKFLNVLKVASIRHACPLLNLKFATCCAVVANSQCLCAATAHSYGNDKAGQRGFEWQIEKSAH